MRSAENNNSNDPLTSALGRLVGNLEAAVPSAWPALCDIRQTPKELTAFLDVPGVDEDEISIKEVGQTLVVRVPREFDHDTEDAEEYTRLERPYGTFEGIIALPNNADCDGMTAKYKRGVLKIRIPLK